MIYFITSGEFVKIGVAKNPQDRLRALQTGNPSPLKLMAVIPGGYETEHVYHELLDDMRVRGEWFKIDKRISSMIRLFSALFGIDGVDIPDARDAKIAMLQSQIDEMNEEDDDTPLPSDTVSPEMLAHFITLHGMGDEIETAQAREALGLSAKGTGNVLRAAVQHGVLDKKRRGVYSPNGVNPNEL